MTCSGSRITPNWDHVFDSGVSSYLFQQVLFTKAVQEMTYATQEANQSIDDPNTDMILRNSLASGSLYVAVRVAKSLQNHVIWQQWHDIQRQNIVLYLKKCDIIEGNGHYFRFQSMCCQ